MSVALTSFFLFFFHESQWDIFFLLCIFSFPFHWVPFHSNSFRFILLYSFLFCSFSPEQQQKKSELQTPPSHLDCVDDTENIHIQADSSQSTAEERNFPQGSLQPVLATVEQLTAEEKTIHQSPVVQWLDNAIHRINHYPVDSAVCFVNSYPLDSNLSGG